MKSKKIISLALALVLALALAAPALADTTIGTSGGTGKAVVGVTAEAATFNVTVPTAAPVSIGADGKTATATVLPISCTATCAGPVKVTAIAVNNLTGEDNAAGDWTIAAYDANRTNLAKEKVGVKKIGLQFLNNAGTQIAVTTGTNDNNGLALTEANIDIINPGETKNVQVNAVTPGQTAGTFENVANVIFTVAWAD